MIWVEVRKDWDISCAVFGRGVVMAMFIDVL